MPRWGWRQATVFICMSRETNGLGRPQDAVDELRALGKDVPESRSFVDELLAERRLAAAAE